VVERLSVDKTDLGTAKSCIIFSQGPVPTPEHTKVEGGGLRCWGLAKGIIANNPNVSVTVAYYEDYKKEDFTEEYEGIHITTWNLDTLPGLIANHDSVIVSYCMSELSVRTADLVGPDQQLILDCYVPIYVEVSARNTSDLDSEYRNFHHDVGRWGHVLRRGDVFLCASEPQKAYYKGVLSALGRINPVTYHDEMILIVPYGVYRDIPEVTEKPITKRLNGKKSKKILWFGGIYPWFDIRVLIDAVNLLNEDIDTTLMIVGAKNPFNTHPDFVRKYDELIEYVEKSGASKFVELQDWIKFEDRADWYLDSDVVVVINQEGPENELAWRTRVVDFAWVNLPIITNGGDPFGEMLLSADAAARFTGLSKEAMADDLLKLLNDPTRLKTIRENLSGVRENLYWDVATQEVTEAILAHTRPADLTKYGYDVITPQAGVRGKVTRIAVKARRLPGYVRKHGVGTAYNAIRTIAVRKVQQRFPVLSQDGPRIVIVSHQLDMSGGPFVIMDFAKELRTMHPDLPIAFYTFNPVHTDNIAQLNRYGIRAQVFIDRAAVMDLRKGDVVVFNTVAHSDQLKEAVFSGLEHGRLAKLVWYVHEDEAEYIFNTQETRRIRELMKNGKIEIVTPAVKIRDNYTEHFGHKEAISLQPYKLVSPDKYKRVLKAKDFTDKLSFILPGTMNDGRKGQLPLFYAFTEFYHGYYKKNPKAYRDFELVFVGVTDDFMSRQILKHADKALEGHLKIYPRVTKKENLDLVMKSNITVCYSMREALPLFVFEGMTAGHPILRNDSSGVDEQLVDGKNGYLLDSTDFQQVIEIIEKIINRSHTSDQELASMSKTSHGMAIAQEHNSYKPMIDTVVKAFGKRRTK
jgi:glycosyltransferase involved in cell wall biosynthesis